MDKLPTKTREDIVRGTITDHAIYEGNYREISLERLAEILREIADELIKN